MMEKDCLNFKRGNLFFLIEEIYLGEKVFILKKEGNI
jgi:hypothetical protein